MPVVQMESPKSTSTDDDIPCLLSQRWILAYVLFMTSFWAYTLRVNLSIAIVCMTKSSVVEDDIRNDFDNQSDLVLHLNGTFNSGGQNQSLQGNRTESEEDTSIKHTQQIDQCEFQSAEKSTYEAEKEFAWSKKLVSTLLSSYFYGAALTQLPGGYLAARFGGKRVLVMSQLVSAVGTLLIPLCARTSPYLLLAVRVIIGLGGGCIFPAIITLWSCWAPPTERGKLTISAVSGALVAIVATFATSGLLCVYGFDNGWGSIFYIHGSLALSQVIVFYYVVHDSPAQHPRITTAEKVYIETALNAASRKTQVFKTPWARIARSRAVWALTWTHLCFNFIFFTVLFTLPLFMVEVLKFDIKQNGLFSALPYIGMLAGMYFAGYMSDVIIKNRKLSVISTRRLFQLSSFLGAVSMLVGAGFVSCQIRGVAVALLCISTIFVGFGLAGFNLNHMDFCGIYTGVVYGLTNAVGNLSGFLGPIGVGLLTPHGTREEWQNVFYVAAGFGVSGAIVFGTCSRGTMATWAKDPTLKDETITLQETTEMLEDGSKENK